MICVVDVFYRYWKECIAGGVSLVVCIADGVGADHTGIDVVEIDDVGIADVAVDDVGTADMLTRALAGTKAPPCCVAEAVDSSCSKMQVPITAIPANISMIVCHETSQGYNLCGLRHALQVTRNRQELVQGHTRGRV